MSKQISITVQLKGRNEVIRFVYQTGLPFFACLAEVLTDAGAAFSLCGGKGICGKCRILFKNGAPMPQQAERRFLTATELRQGVRLACMTKPVRDCHIEVLFAQDTRVITGFCAEGKETCAENGKNGGAKGEVFLAADIGTTTIAMALADSMTDRLTDTYTCMNPQAAYGADVIARIAAAEKEGMEKLQKVLGEALRKGAKTLGHTEKIYVAANTVMSHFLAGSDVSGLGKAPFKPVFTGRRELQLCGVEIVILPGISAFVGGDITAGLLSCGLLPVKGENRGVLFLDLGTNGEMALCTEDRIYCAAAAAGPAFEGKSGENRGSHMVRILAGLLREGKMDATGLLLTDGVPITQKEIRDLQMAKAAVRTGIEVLLKKAGLNACDVRKIYLAGGFGYYVEASDAAQIGLIPEEFKDRVISVGNASLQGAAVYAGLEKERQGFAEELERDLRTKCVSVNLAEEDYFLENYIDQMNF